MKRIIALVISSAAIAGTVFAETAIDNQNSKAALVRISPTPESKAEHTIFDGERLSSKSTASVATSGTKGSSVDRTQNCSKREHMADKACKVHCGA